MRREKRAFWAAALTVLLLTAEGCAPEPDVPPQPEEPPAVQAEAPNPMPVRRAKPAPVPIPKPRPEPAPEPEEPADETLVTVTDYIPGIFVELKYATEDNFTGQVIYGFTDARLRYGTVKKLARVQAALLEQGYSLKIWDACRPVSAQFALWEVCPDPVYVGCLKDLRQRMRGYPCGSCCHTVPIIIPRCPVNKRKIKNRKHQYQKNHAPKKSHELLRKAYAQILIEIFFTFGFHLSLPSQNPSKLPCQQIKQISELLRPSEQEKKNSVKRRTYHHKHHGKGGDGHGPHHKGLHR